MKITLNGDDLKISIETDALGSFASGFHVPEISAGVYTIEAEDQNGSSATAAITISPRHKRGSVGSIYRTGQEAPVSGKYRCEQCESAGTINYLPLAKEDNFPPCSRCRADGRPGGSKYMLIEIFE